MLSDKRKKVMMIFFDMLDIDDQKKSFNFIVGLTNKNFAELDVKLEVSDSIDEDKITKVPEKTQPKKKRMKKLQIVVFGKSFGSMKSACEFHQKNYQTAIKQRIEGISLEEIFFKTDKTIIRK